MFFTAFLSSLFSRFKYFGTVFVQNLFPTFLILVRKTKNRWKTRRIKIDSRGKQQQTRSLQTKFFINFENRFSLFFPNFPIFAPNPIPNPLFRKPIILVDLFLNFSLTIEHKNCLAPHYFRRGNIIKTLFSVESLKIVEIECEVVSSFLGREGRVRVK